MKNLNLKTVVVVDQYPHVIKVFFQDSYLTLIKSPFGNCQTFSINNAKALGHLTEENFFVVLKEIINLMCKHQFVMDLREIDQKKIENLISPYAANIQKMPYISTNESKMCLYLVQADKEKIPIE